MAEHKRRDLASIIDVCFFNCVLSPILILPTRWKTSQGQGFEKFCILIFCNHVFCNLMHSPELNVKWVLNTACPLIEMQMIDYFLKRQLYRVSKIVKIIFLLWINFSLNKLETNKALSQKMCLGYHGFPYCIQQECSKFLWL